MNIRIVDKQDDLAAEPKVGEVQSWTSMCE